MLRQHESNSRLIARSRKRKNTFHPQVQKLKIKQARRMLLKKNRGGEAVRNILTEKDGCQGSCQVHQWLSKQTTKVERGQL
jgi:hypothetical protein